MATGNSIHLFAWPIPLRAHKDAPEAAAVHAQPLSESIMDMQVTDASQRQRRRRHRCCLLISKATSRIRISHTHTLSPLFGVARLSDGHLQRDSQQMSCVIARLPLRSPASEPAAHWQMESNYVACGQRGVSLLAQSTAWRCFAMYTGVRRQFGARRMNGLHSARV